LFQIARPLFAALMWWSAMFPAAARQGTFPQLISTRYEAGRGVPAEARKPAPAVTDVGTNKLPEGERVISMAKSASGRVWLLTDRGLYRLAAGGFEQIPFGGRRREPGQPEVRGPAQVTALAADRLGHIWIGTDRGVFLSNGEDWWQRLGSQESASRDAVPVERIHCLHLNPGGDVWAGTPEGAWRLRDGRFRYFWGKRWLCDNDVQTIWTDATGRAWIETRTGVACIEERPTTLAAKAAHYD
jgi:ligand-binding sensor domain-containing protein